MKRVLVVKSAFGDHTRGSVIDDPAEIERVLAGGNAHHVSVSTHDVEAAPPGATEAVPAKRKTERNS
jgi:hypothetical protein